MTCDKRAQADPIPAFSGCDCVGRPPEVVVNDRGRGVRHANTVFHGAVDQITVFCRTEPRARAEMLIEAAEFPENVGADSQIARPIECADWIAAPREAFGLVAGLKSKVAGAL